MSLLPIHAELEIKNISKYQENKAPDNEFALLKIWVRPECMLKPTEADYFMSSKPEGH